MGEFHEWFEGCPYLYLARVMTHLANHYPLTEGDSKAWEIVDYAQTLCDLEEKEREGNRG